MEEDILKAIVAAEREIRERLVAEERKAAELLENLRNELEAETGREEARLSTEVGNAVAAARAEAQGRADAIVSAAALRGEQLAGLDDETLESWLMKHLIRIAPEPGQ